MATSVYIWVSIHVWGDMACIANTCEFLYMMLGVTCLVKLTREFRYMELGGGGACIVYKCEFLYMILAVAWLVEFTHVSFYT